MNHIKIKEYKVALKGVRGRVVALPKVWLDDNRVAPGDSVEFYRTMIDNHDCLILKIKKDAEEIKHSTSQIPVSA